VYGYKLGERIHKKVVSLSERNKYYDSVAPFIQKWQDIYSALDDVRLADEGTKEYYINKLIKALEANNQPYASFPYFEPFTIDIETGLSGTMKKKGKGQSLFMYITKEGDEYELALNISFDSKVEGTDDEEPTKIKTNIFELGLNINELIDILKTQFKNIEKIVAAMERLPYHYEMYENKYINDLAVIYGYCKQLASKLDEDDISRISSNIATHIFDIKAEDVAYTKSEKNEAIYSFSAEFFDDVEGTNAIKGVASAEGLWYSYEGDYFMGTLYAAANTKADAENITNLQQLKEKVARLKQIVRHEVQHVIQDFISKIKKMREDAGLPSRKIRDPKYRPSGMPVKKEPESPEGGRIKHELRDVEFYTRISDEVDKFNNSKTHLPVSMHKDLMLAWVAQISYDDFMSIEREKLTEIAYSQFNEDPKKYLSPPVNVKWHLESLISRANKANNILWGGRAFFAELKDHQPEKYKKAVSEFLKAISI